MFTITRSIYETFYIIIGTIEIEVCILDIQGKQAKLSLKIPKSGYISNKDFVYKKN